MKRLEVIASLIRPCDVFADIGCDHGLIARYVSDNRLAGRVYATDISAAALRKAEKLLADCDNAAFLLGDGFAPLDANGIYVDEAVIAGVGGELIIKMLSATHSRPSLVLGAQKNADKLRVYLAADGYNITDDVKVSDDGKFYDIIRAERGYMPVPDAIHAFMGVHYERKNPDMAAYCEYLGSKLDTFKKTERNLALAGFVREVKKWQR